MESDVNSPSAPANTVVGTSQTGSFDEAIKDAVQKAAKAAKPDSHSDQLILEVSTIRVTAGGFIGQSELHVTAEYWVNSSRRGQSMEAEKEQEISGCLRKGTEANCIILETLDKKAYSLHGDSLPPLGEKLVVEVKGKPGGVSTCNEGTPFQVTSWNLTKKRCPEHNK
jgi:hypothetical protein